MFLARTMAGCIAIAKLFILYKFMRNELDEQRKRRFVTAGVTSR